jgi:hypothetical protein
MSNLSIIERLEDRLAAYAEGKVRRDEFVSFLSNSIQALEGVPLNVIHELRDHQYDVETEGYFDEEGFEENRASAQENLAVWLHSLKEKYCAHER